MATKEKNQAEAEADVDVQVEQPASATKRKAAAVDEIEVDLEAPEPPSKRARRALKKGKPLPEKVDSDDEKADQKDKKEKNRSEHGVWVGNLPFKLTAAELRKWLVENSGGTIKDESITRIKLPTKKEPGRDKSEKPTNKGFAYVDFVDVSAKVAAIALSEADLQARRLLIKDSTSFEGRPAKEKESEDAENAEAKDPNASRKIFVGNMGFKTTQDDLTRNFEKCGEIEWAKLATFEDTGKCKGFGWIRFTEPEAAAWAVKGFVKIKEAVETEDDFKEAKDGSDSESGDEKPQQKQFKTRKWWVNRMFGRELKIELAEDDQLRYRKRFGKDAPHKQFDGPRPPQQGGRKDGRRDGRNDRRRDGDANGEPLGDASAPKKARPMKESEDLQVARLTGAMVKPTGTKMTFD